MDEITEAMLRIVAERDYTKTLKDAAVEQLTIARQERDAAIAERDAAREEAAALHERVLRLRDACESVAQNMEASGQLWSSWRWHTSIAIARLRDALDMTASDNSSHVAP